MELEFNKQFLLLQNDLNNFKTTLSPLFQLLQDIQDIRKRHHISQANNVSNYSLLVMDIKEEVLKEVSHINNVTETKIEDLRKDTNTSIYDCNNDIANVRDEIFKVFNTLKEMNSEIFTTKNQGGENSMYIKEMKKELDKKANITNLDDLRTVVRTMTPLTNYDSLKARVNDCVTIYQFQNLEKTVEEIQEKMLEFMTVSEAEKKLKEFTEKLDHQFQASYITSKSFEVHREHYDKLFAEMNSGLIQAKEYSSKLDKGTNDKLMLIKKAFDSKPWKTELNVLQETLSKMMPQSELMKFINTTNTQVSDFSLNMHRFRVSVEKFENVLERFDEILLDKAEKDQITKINKVLETLAPNDTVESIKKGMTSFTKDNEARFMAQCALVEKLKSNFDYLIERFECFKKDNYDVTNFAHTIAEFKEYLDRKADKQDIYEIYDNMCKRIEYVEVNEYIKLLKKQVEQGISLVFALCRTLVKNGESPGQIKKERYELLKHLNSLINWISEENCKTYNSPTLKTKEWGEDEDRISLRQSALHRRRSVMTARENKYMHVDFPKIS